MTKYAGADWLQTQINYRRKPYVLSALAREVADIMGQLLYGLYHWESAETSGAWKGDKEISVCISDELASNSLLTLLVLLAHRRKIVVAIQGAAPRYLRLIFRRNNEHKSIEEAIVHFENVVNFGAEDS
jgi:hypothetical protein